VPGDPPEDVQLRVGSLVIDRRVALGLLDEVLDELRPDDRTVLAAFYKGGQDCAAAAIQCGIPLNLVKVRLFRARRRLRGALRRKLARLSGEEQERMACGDELELASA
jgi:DNA-directed RNA polymerase specialized sigma24 family protein